MANMDELLQMAPDELVRLVLRLRAELEHAQLKLGLARATIADNQASIKRKTRALRNMSLQRRSLRDTVKRRRKNGK